MDDVRRWFRWWVVSVGACAGVWAGATVAARVLDSRNGSKVL